MEHLLPYFLNFEEDIARAKDVQRTKDFWAKLAWELESCAEARELFPDMTICPVCMEHKLEGHLVHKLRMQIEN